MHDTFKLFEERCMRRGRGFRQFWYLSAACSVAESQLDPSCATVARDAAPGRLSKLYLRAMESWEKEARTENLAGLLPGTELQTPGIHAGSWLYSANVLGVSAGSELR